MVREYIRNQEENGEHRDQFKLGVQRFTTRSGYRTFVIVLANRKEDEESPCAILRYSTDEMLFEYIEPGISSV